MPTDTSPSKAAAAAPATPEASTSSAPSPTAAAATPAAAPATVAQTLPATPASSDAAPASDAETVAPAAPTTADAVEAPHQRHRLQHLEEAFVAEFKELEDKAEAFARKFLTWVSNKLENA
jgi:hypothetical protein